MATKRICLLAILAGVISIWSESSVEAQVPRLRVAQRSHDVTIISRFGIPVRVGIFGYAKDATFRLDFDGGRSGPDVYTQELIAGERVVFVWDTARRPLLVAQVSIDSDGELELGPLYAAAASEPGAARDAAPKEGFGLPQLQIKPKN